MRIGPIVMGEGEEKMSEKRVEIVGLDRASLGTYLPSPGWDVWTLNVWYDSGWPSVIPDRAFELHQAGELLPVSKGVHLLDLDRVHAAYAKWGVQVWTIEKGRGEFPLCEEAKNLHVIQEEELYALFPEEPKEFLFSSSFSYMIAQAKREGYTHIRLCCCPLRDEYRFELASLWRMIQLLEEKWGICVEVQFGDEWAVLVSTHPEMIREEREKAVAQGMCYIDMKGSVIDHQYVTPTYTAEMQARQRERLMMKLRPQIAERQRQLLKERIATLEQSRDPKQGQRGKKKNGKRR